MAKDDFRAFLQRNADTLELDENVYIERLRKAGVFRNVADELRELVGFRHFTSMMKEGLFDKPSPPPRARARKPSLKSRVKAAREAGASVDIKPDGTVSAVFGEQAADTNQQDEVETWIQKHAH